MMKKDIVSIIVPIYKVYKFIQEAVNSTTNQVYSELEIVLVDDGSPDECPEICDESLLADSRIITMHKKNGGLSDSRNYGLELASGDYVAFLDSDDYFTPLMIEKMMETANKGDADIVICNVDEIDEDGNKMKESSYISLNDSIYSSDEALSELTGQKERTMTVTWNKLYRGSLWHSIRFPVGKIHEDVFTTYRLLDASKVVITVQDRLYIHRIRSGSIMTTRKANSYQCSIEAFTNLLDFYVSKGLERAIVNTDLHCFEAIKSTFWSGYYHNDDIEKAITSYREKYNRAAFRGRFLQFRMNLFWKCPAAERIIYLIWRKVVTH